MKKTFAVIILFVISLTNLNGQSQFGSIAKFGLAVGYSPMWIVPNLEPINNQLSGFGVESLPNSGMYVSGVGGYAYVLFIKNLRIGGMGYSGDVTRNNSKPGNNREVSFHTGGGVVTIEYSFPGIKKFDLSLGMMIGGGTQEISIYRNNGSFSWNGIWNHANTDSSSASSFSEVLKNSFFTLAPTLNIDLPINRFMAFRIGGGYVFSIGNNWTAANEQQINNVPSDLNGNSFFIQTGIYIGFFAF